MSIKLRSCHLEHEYPYLGIAHLIDLVHGPIQIYALNRLVHDTMTYGQHCFVLIHRSHHRKKVACTTSDGLERLHIVDRKSTRLNSSHANISYAVFCLKKKK